MTAGDHAEVASLELQEVDNLAGVDVVTDGVVDLDQWVGVADGAAVVRDQEGDALRAGLNALDFAELILGLFSGDLVKNISALGVIEQTEEITGSFDGDNI